MKKQNLVAKIILVLSLLSVLLLIVTPMQFLNYSKGGVHAIWGWTGIFGGDASLQLSGVVKTLTYDFNWVMYVACILTVVMGVTTFLIAQRNKGYYIFSAIVFAILAIIFFTISSTWLESTVNWGGTAGHQGKPLGVGPWFAGLAASFSAIGSIVANRMSK